MDPRDTRFLTRQIRPEKRSCGGFWDGLTLVYHFSAAETRPAISHDILEFSARVLTQWAVSFPNALDA